MSTALTIKTTKRVTDKNGASWIVMSTTDTILRYVASSGDYPGADNPSLDALTESGISSEIASFAKSHKPSGSVTKYADKNDVSWIITVEQRDLTDDVWRAATDQYGGQWLADTDLEQLRKAIDGIAASPPGGITPPKPPTEKPPKTKADAFKQALTIAKGAGADDTTALGLAAVGEFESHLGLQAPFLLADGSPSYNWGAVMALPGSLSFVGPLGRSWARFLAMKDGFSAFFNVPSIQASLAAWKNGDALAAAAIMFDGGYYEPQAGCAREDCIRAYANGVVAVAQQIADATGVPMTLHATGDVPASSKPDTGIPYVAVGLAGGMLYVLYKLFTSKNDVRPHESE